MNVKVAAPMVATPAAARNDASAIGDWRSEAYTTRPLPSRSPCRRPTASSPRSTATRNTPARTGTATVTFSSVSATNCAAITCQFAAATSAPRLRAVRRGSGCAICAILPEHVRFLPALPRDVRRLAAIGVALAALVVAAGYAIEVARFGRTDAVAFARVEADVTRDLESMSDEL